MRSWKVGLPVLLVVPAAACAQILDFDEYYKPPEPAVGAGAGMGGAGGSGAASAASSDPSTGGAGASSASTSSAGGLGGGTAYAWDAQTATMTPEGTFTLPPWLVFESLSPDKTSQTSPATLKTGFGVDAVRARNVTGKPSDWGLSIESERKNAVKYSDSWSKTPEWALLPTPSTMAIAPMQPDPAGGMAATLFASTGNQASAYFVATGRAVSGWFRGKGVAGDPGVPGGPMSYAHFRHVDAAGAAYKEVNSATWTRYSFTNIMDSTDTIMLETRDRPTGAGSITTPTEIFAFGAQIEPGAAYPSSYIPTTDNDRTRKAEKLWSPMVQALAPEGFFRIELRFAPNYASGEQAGNHDLLYFKDESNRIYLRAGDNAVVMRIAAEEMASSSLEWSREQQLSIVVINTASERSLSITGATHGNGTTSQMAGEPMGLASDLYILGNAGGAQECADLRYISFAPP